jgi:quinol monooxygenase YgiN
MLAATLDVRRSDSRTERISFARPAGCSRRRVDERLTMEFVVIARYLARAGEEDRVEAALREMVEPTRAEPGNLDYQVFRDPEQPAVFMLFERYTGADAFEAHRASEHFTTWLGGQVLPALAERTRFDLVPLTD